MRQVQRDLAADEVPRSLLDTGALGFAAAPRRVLLRINEAAAMGEGERPQAGLVKSAIDDKCNIRGETTPDVLRPHDQSSNLN